MKQPTTVRAAAHAPLYSYTGPVLETYDDQPEQDFRRWLTDNPERVAFVGPWADKTWRLPGRALVIAFRVLDPRHPSGWRVAVHQLPEEEWQYHCCRVAHVAPGSYHVARVALASNDPSVANSQALEALCDEAMECPALRTAVALLVLPDKSALCEVWEPDFLPVAQLFG